MTHDFDQQSNFSTSPAAHALVRRACHRLIPDCCGLTLATQAEDRSGADYWVITPKGRIGLDLKLRTRDHGAVRGRGIDCVIELDGWGSSGCLQRAGGAELVLFAYADTGRFALFNRLKLRTAVMLNLSRWIADGRAKEVQTTSHRDGRYWKSNAVIISGDLLAEAIDRLDDGDWVEAANEWDPA